VDAYLAGRMAVMLMTPKYSIEESLSIDVVYMGMEDYPWTILELEKRFAIEAACWAYLIKLRWLEVLFVIKPKTLSIILFPCHSPFIITEGLFMLPKFL